MHHYFSLHYSYVSNRDAAARIDSGGPNACINVSELCNLSFIVYAALSDNVITRISRYDKFAVIVTTWRRGERRRERGRGKLFPKLASLECITLTPKFAATHEITSDMRLSANRYKYGISPLKQPVVVA